MTHSPKKFLSNFTSSTTNRGVEAKEVEIANTQLDVCASTHRAAAAAASSSPQHVADQDDTASYIQVEVRRTRLPAASSPAPPAPAPTTLQTRPDHCTVPTVEASRAVSAQDNTRRWRGAGGDVAAQPPDGPQSAGRLQTVVWKKSNANENGGDNSTVYDGVPGPERLEVYYFERGDASYLATSGGEPETSVERWARAWGRLGRAALGEALAVPVVACGAAAAAGVAAERAALRAARGAAVGALQTAADYALKPALALTFNAALQPALVFTGAVLRALRAALAPLWGALGDALEPPARLLGALRLVHVHVERPAPAPASAPAPTVAICPHCSNSHVV